MPGPGDKLNRTAFWRRDPSHQRIARKVWAASGETPDYLGDWHSHPQVQPTPSGTDLPEWQKILSGREEAMAFLILGTAQIWLGVGLGEGIRQITDSGV